MRVPNDFDFTTRRVEQDEELEAVAWAENNGWVARKTQYIGRVGCPDRFFFGHGYIVPVEFKKPDQRNRKNGGKSIGQVKEHERLLAVGVEVKVFYTQQECVAYLKSLM